MFENPMELVAAGVTFTSSTLTLYRGIAIYLLSVLLMLLSFPGMDSGWA
jgi:hypothetical protein